MWKLILVTILASWDGCLSKFVNGMQSAICTFSLYLFFLTWALVFFPYSIAIQEYDKDKALSQDAEHGIRLSRLGEVYSYTPTESKEHPSEVAPPRVWFANSEKLARRQVPDHAAFFHFRAWNDDGSRR